jgi:hypothetical protein
MQHDKFLISRLDRLAASINDNLDLADLKSVRAQIVEMMVAALELHRHALDDWRKTHFSNAIGALSLNIHSLRQPTSSWLRLCLSDLIKAVISAEHRDRGYRTEDPSMRDVSYEQLLSALDSIGREIG